MARENHRLIRKRIQDAKAVEHCFGIAAREIGATTSVEKQGVSRNEGTSNVKTLTPRGVAGCVYAFDLDPTHGDDVAAIMKHEMIGSDSGGFLDPGSFVPIDVNWHIDTFEKS